MWIHAGFGHLFSNMFAVIIFAPILEKSMGFKEIFHILFSYRSWCWNSIFWSKFFWKLFIRDSKVKTYQQNPNPENFRKFILENSKEYYNQLYDFISGYSENPNNEEYIKGKYKY